MINLAPTFEGYLRNDVQNLYSEHQLKIEYELKLDSLPFYSNGILFQWKLIFYGFDRLLHPFDNWRITRT
jgi:hypothetical protein